jgi:hypothetical protein
MLISLINMNKIINQIWFSMYPKTEPVPESPGASFAWLDIVLVSAVRCIRSKSLQCNGRREVVEMILMFTWGTQVWPPGCRGRSHSRSKRAVTWRCSPKTWLPALSSRIFSVQRFQRPALTSTVCAELGMGMQRATEGERRGLLTTL